MSMTNIYSEPLFIKRGPSRSQSPASGKERRPPEPREDVIEQSKRRYDVITIDDDSFNEGDLPPKKTRITFNAPSLHVEAARTHVEGNVNEDTLRPLLGSSPSAAQESPSLDKLGFLEDSRSEDEALSRSALLRRNAMQAQQLRKSSKTQIIPTPISITESVEISSDSSPTAPVSPSRPTLQARRSHQIPDLSNEDIERSLDFVESYMNRQGTSDASRNTLLTRSSLSGQSSGPHPASPKAADKSRTQSRHLPSTTFFGIERPEKASLSGEARLQAIKAQGPLESPSFTRLSITDDPLGSPATISPTQKPQTVKRPNKPRERAAPIRPKQTTKKKKKPSVCQVQRQLALFHKQQDSKDKFERVEIDLDQDNDLIQPVPDSEISEDETGADAYRAGSRLHLIEQDVPMETATITRHVTSIVNLPKPSQAPHMLLAGDMLERKRDATYSVSNGRQKPDSALQNTQRRKPTLRLTPPVDEIEETKQVHKYQVQGIFEGFEGKDDGETYDLGTCWTRYAAIRKYEQDLAVIQDVTANCSEVSTDFRKCLNDLPEFLMRAKGLGVACRLWVEQVIVDVSEHVYLAAKEQKLISQSLIHFIRWDKSITPLDEPQNELISQMKQAQKILPTNNVNSDQQVVENPGTTDQVPVEGLIPSGVNGEYDTHAAAKEIDIPANNKASHLSPSDLTPCHDLNAVVTSPEYVGRAASLVNSNANSCSNDALLDELFENPEVASSSIEQGSTVDSAANTDQSSMELTQLTLYDSRAVANRAASQIYMDWYSDLMRDLPEVQRMQSEIEEELMRCGDEYDWIKERAFEVEAENGVVTIRRIKIWVDHKEVRGLNST